MNTLISSRLESFCFFSLLISPSFRIGLGQEELALTELANAIEKSSKILTFKNKSKSARATWEIDNTSDFIFPTHSNSNLLNNSEFILVATYITVIMSERDKKKGGRQEEEESQ